jgi:hypothetical protein
VATAGAGADEASRDLPNDRGPVCRRVGADGFTRGMTDTTTSQQFRNSKRHFRFDHDFNMAVPAIERALSGSRQASRCTTQSHLQRSFRLSELRVSKTLVPTTSTSDTVGAWGCASPMFDLENQA